MEWETRGVTFTAEERAISPVIGVILMVAITVILAAVGGVFFLGIGQAQEQSPTVSFDMADEGGGDVVITHLGGDDVEAANLNVDCASGSYSEQFSGCVQPNKVS